MTLSPIDDAGCGLRDGIYLSLDFFVVRAVTFFGLGLLDFADPWPFRPWSGFVGCWNVCSFVRLGWVPVMFGLLPRSPPWFIFALLYPDFYSFKLQPPSN